MALSAASETELVKRLRARDEDAFRTLLDSYSPVLLQVAMAHTPSRAVAEEAVQETWLAVMRGIDGFEARSSLKTWLISIVTNLAIRRGTRERRSVPFASLAGSEGDSGPSVDPDRFLPADHERYPGHWAVPPVPWPTPEEGLLAAETRRVIVEAVEALPAAQRVVVTLRDIHGWEPDEVCEALEISPANQRVLLHRARTKVRAAVERYFSAVTSPPSTGTEKHP